MARKESLVSHIVITCTCGADQACEVPGHGSVPLEVDPWVLVSAGEEALGHMRQAMNSIISARHAWVSRGLPGENPFPLSLDRETAVLASGIDRLRSWVDAARKVAERRS